MAGLLERRDDGSLALFIDGDLQFDSRDERIYHETLALPALAIAERRRQGPLRALVCGGGDGLAARELLKSPRLVALDLVDYDADVLGMGCADLAELNGHSLHDPRVSLHVEDAWGFVQRTADEERRYDLIVCDLTVPHDSAGARLHSVEWYASLARLLTEDGVLAANSTSPSATPDGFWSIYNSMRAAGLHPRPYRIALPSFTAMQYGEDWGFLLAAGRPILVTEFDDDLALAAPRQALRDAAHLRRLFVFPTPVAERRARACPAGSGSDILLHYLYNGGEPAGPGGTPWDALGFETDTSPVPVPDEGPHLLPPEIRAAMSVPPGDRPDEETLLRRVLALMPALERAQTREMIAAFLEQPARFLAGLDLRGLVERLLRRASALPRRLVAELRLLRRVLRAFAGDHDALLRLGMRIVTVITAVVIVANLLQPDALYGKGGTHVASGSDYVVGLERPDHSVYFQPDLQPILATGGGYRSPRFRSGLAVDETGAMFPLRTYHYYPRYYGYRGYTLYQSGNHPTGQPAAAEADYRLTSEASILGDGQVVVDLTDTAYLLLGDRVLTVVDRQSGKPLLYLKRQPALIYRTAQELDRQHSGLHMTMQAKQQWMDWLDWLSFVPWRGDDSHELANMKQMAARLDLARKGLGQIPSSAPSLPSPPVTGAVEVFSSVWMLPDGSALVLEMPDGRLAYMDNHALYGDPARTHALTLPYPSGFKAVVLRYLSDHARDRAAAATSLQQQLSDANANLASLESDRQSYQTDEDIYGSYDDVDYGSDSIPVVQALALTDADVASTKKQIAEIERQLGALPAEARATAALIQMLGR